MKKNSKFLIYLFLLAGLYFYSCSSSGNSPSPFIKYNFILLDSNSSKLSEGVLFLESAVSKKFSGNYKVNKMFVDKVDGLSSKGKLAGTVNDSTQTIFINMNPKIADANLFISAKPAGDSLNGTWMYSTLMGTKSKGLFKSVKSD